MSPMTIVWLDACLPVFVNAAQAVRPSGGVIRTPAAVALMSARGNETLKTPSLASSAPLAPVSASIAAVSKLAAGLSAAHAAVAVARIEAAQNAAHAGIAVSVLMSSSSSTPRKGRRTVARQARYGFRRWVA